MQKQNMILERSFEFALQIIELYRRLVAEKEFIISKQLLRSGTSIGANVEEATAAIFKKEFIAKMSISSKEVREKKYWLRLRERSKLVNLEVSEQLKEIEHIINIITAIVKTSQGNVK